MKPYLFFLIVLSSFLLFFHLGKRPLLSSGEARASEIAIEMMQRGNLLIPYLNEEILLTKPLLFHWLIIFNYKLFGVNEFSSRIPSALSGILVVMLVYFLGKKYWDKRTGFIAGVLLLTSPLFFWSARCARIDALLLFLVTTALYCFWRGYEKLPESGRWFHGWFLFMGLGMLAKGPVGVLVPLGVAVIFLLLTGKKQLLKKLNWISGIIIFLVVVCPWYIAIYFLVPHHKAGIFFVQQIFVWIIGGGNWYKGYVYIPGLFAGFFPWSIAIPLMLICTWKDFRYKRDEKTVFLWTWMLFVFFIFFFFGKKANRYILGLYPPVALLLANVINTRKNINRILSYTMVLVWFFLILSINFFSLYSRYIDPQLVYLIKKYVNVFWITTTGILIIIFGLYGVRKRSVTILSAILYASLVMFIVYFIPIERDFYSPIPFCEMLKKEIPENVILRAYKHRSWDNSIRYYYGRHVDIVEKEERLRRLLDSNKEIYCIMWNKVYERLPEGIKGKLFIIKSDYKVLEKKFILVSNVKDS